VPFVSSVVEKTKSNSQSASRIDTTALTLPVEMTLSARESGRSCSVLRKKDGFLLGRGAVIVNLSIRRSHGCESPLLEIQDWPFPKEP